jgi:hypothetical protein
MEQVSVGSPKLKNPTIKVDNIHSIVFNIFDLNDVYGNIRTLDIMSTNVFHHWNLFDDLEIDYETF